MRIVVLPVESDQTEEELTDRLALAIAGEIWRLCGRQGDLDWLEAERMLAEVAAEAKAEACDAVFVGGHGWGSGERAGWQQPHVAALGAE